MICWKRVLPFALAFSLSASATAVVSAAPITSYENPTQPSAYNPTPIVAPKWTLSLDAPTESRWLSTVRVASGNALFVRGGVLTAVDVQSGRTVWTYGSGLRDDFRLFDDRAFAASDDGRLHWIDLASGKAAWTSLLRKPEVPESPVFHSVAAGDDAIYVTSIDGIAAFDRGTGTKRWVNDTFENVGYVSLHGEHLLHMTAEQGALTVIANYAIDRETGKTIWRLGGSHGALEKIEGDIGWFRDDYAPGFTMDMGPSYARYDLVDLNTGEIVDAKTFGPLPAPADPTVFGGISTVIDDDWLFAAVPTGAVAQFHLEAEEGAKPIASFGGGNHEWIAGPYDGKLFSLNKTGPSLYAMRLLDRTPLYYEGIDSPPSRIDWIERGVFVGQTDGHIYALNVATGKAAFRYRTEARAFGPFHVENGVLLAQAEGRLLAFALPAELLQAGMGEGASGGVTSPPAAEATLKIDGQSQRFEPAPVMLDNRMFVPLRALFQAVGATVHHDQATGLVHVTYRDRVFSLEKDAPFATVGGGQRPMSYAPVAIRDALYVPLRDVGGLLGIDVLWVTETRTVEITTKPQP
jgi:outer membrane protein assembly factor BamB